MEHRARSLHRSAPDAAASRRRFPQTNTWNDPRMSRKTTLGRWGAPIAPRPRFAGGAGFTVRADVLTDAHGVSGVDRISVTLHDRRSPPARVIGTDPTTEVAVIEVDAANLPVRPLGRSGAVRVGEWVMAIGNPGFGDREFPADRRGDQSGQLGRADDRSGRPGGLNRSQAFSQPPRAASKKT